jgi:surface protein
MVKLKKFSDVDISDIEKVSSVSSLAKIDDVSLGSPLIVRLEIDTDGESWRPRVKMFSGTGFINWGDGTPTEPISTVLPSPHTYATAGTYDVTVTPVKGFQTAAVDADVKVDRTVTEVVAFGDCGSVGFSSWESLVTIPLDGYLDLTGIEFFKDSIFREAFDFVGPTSMSGYASLSLPSSLASAFTGVSLFNRPGLNDLDTSSVTDMQSMFSGASAFNQPLDTWDVSGVTNMGSMFSNADAFNQPLNSWVVSSVTDMSSMFARADVFNQDISSWDVSSVTDMTLMFSLATAFNQPLNSWNVSSVTDMGGMFGQATDFNQDISAWVVSSVTDMGSMFNTATAFNQDISGWVVSSVTDMGLMFSSATAFDQDISGWNVSSVTNMRSMFFRATAFNQDLSSWNVSNVGSFGSMFSEVPSFDQNLGAWTFKDGASIATMLLSSGISDANLANTIIGWNAQPLQGTSVNWNELCSATLSESATVGVDGYDGAAAKSAYDNIVLPTGSGGLGWTGNSIITWVA